MGVDVVELNLRSEDSEVKGDYEYYYTKKLKPGHYAKIGNITATMPNRVNTDLTEIGVYDGAKYMAVRYRGAQGSVLALTSRGTIWMAPRDRIYLKTTGTTVDTTVRLHARGLSCSSLPTI